MKARLASRSFTRDLRHVNANNSCNINGHCYAAFDVNMNDCCQQCLPEISIDSWSVRQEDMAPTVLTSNPYPAIHQEQLNFTFDIKDHEQCSITFSMISAFENATISQDGKFNWLPSVSSANQESMFNITMHDKCGFSAIVLFAVNICKCENSEVCAFVNGSSLYDCVCPEQLDDVSCGKEISTNYTQGTDSTVNPTTVIQISSFSQDQDDSTTDIFDVSDTSSSGSTTTNSGNSNVGNLSPKSSTSNSGTDNLNTSPPTDSFTVLERTSTVTTNKTSTTYVEGTDSTVNSITVPQISSFPENQDDSTTDIFDFADRSPSVSTSANYGNSDIADPSPKPSTSNSGTDNLKTSPLTNTVTIHERTSMVNTNKTSTTYTQGTNATVNPITVPRISSFSQDQDDSKTGFDFTDATPSVSTSANYQNSNVGNSSPKPSTLNSGTDNFKTSPLAYTFTVHERTSTVNTNMTPLKTTIPDNYGTTAIRNHETIGISSAQVNPSPTHYIKGTSRSQGNTMHTAPQTNSDLEDLNNTTEPVSVKKTEVGSTILNTTPMKTTIPDGHGSTATRHEGTSERASAQVSSTSNSPTAPQASTGLIDLNNTTKTATVTKKEVDSTILNEQTMNYQEAIKLTLQGREEQWISAKQAFRASVSKAVNSFCYSNARKCCSVTDFNEQDTLDGDVTTSENVNLNERISESQIVIVLSIKHNNYIETCFQNNDDDRARRDVINHQYNNVFRQRRNTNEYISADVVKSSIEQGKTNIETEILMDIVDVSLYNTEESEEGGKYPKSYTMFIVVGACCFAVIGLLVFGVCFYKMYV
ncbi:mucin-5AC-like [Anneissia japonica]|uniref:mucin-5AC-like n=1 Tax=Anneissia japonica TaxID=1529436 RepID=UPI001425A40A|nr:mucin-5AC-like [Anneissia japonica]